MEDYKFIITMIVNLLEDVGNEYILKTEKNIHNKIENSNIKFRGIKNMKVQDTFNAFGYNNFIEVISSNKTDKYVSLITNNLYARLDRSKDNNIFPLFVVTVIKNSDIQFVAVLDNDDFANALNNIATFIEVGYYNGFITEFKYKVTHDKASGESQDGVVVLDHGNIDRTFSLNTTAEDIEYFEFKMSQIKGDTIQKVRYQKIIQQLKIIQLVESVVDEDGLNNMCCFNEKLPNYGDLIIWRHCQSIKGKYDLVIYDKTIEWIDGDEWCLVCKGNKFSKQLTDK